MLFLICAMLSPLSLARDYYVVQLDDAPTLTDSPQVGPGEEIDPWLRDVDPATHLPDLGQVSNLDRYDGLFLEVADQTGVPAAMLKAVCVAESRMNPWAISRAGAQGLMQLMPGTARNLGVTNPFDPEQSVDGGARFLSKMRADFGTWELALAAYNAGPAAVRAHNGVPPYRETLTYVDRVMSLYDHFRTIRPI